MPSNSQEITQAANTLINFQDQISAAIENVNSEISILASNPSTPNAKKQFEKIVSLREQTITTPWNNNTPALITNLNNALYDSTPDAIEQTKPLVTTVRAKQGEITAASIYQRDVALPKLLQAINGANDSGQIIFSNLLNDDQTFTRSNTDTAGLGQGVVALLPQNIVTNNNPNTGNNLGAGEGIVPTSSNNDLVGPSDGDSLNTPVATSAGKAEGFGSDFSNPAFNPAKDSQAAYISGLSAGKTNSNAGNTISNNNTPSRPGVRLQNPLSSFSSYTYNISLYMVTPESYNAFLLSGRKNIFANKQGVFLIAQSGGINNKTQQRAPGFELDFYIDDLKIKTTTSGKSSTTSTNTTEMNFNIYEPYGFSFFSNLRRASLAVSSATNVPGASQSNNPLKQIYILSIKFQGYDETGKLISSADVNANNQNNNFYRGIQEKFYDIAMVDVKFKLDGRLSTYRITAVSLAPSQAFGLKRGRIDHRFGITANTVRNALEGEEGLLSKLNEQQVLLSKKINPKTGKPAIEYPNIYQIKFIGDAENIAGAKLVVKDKFRFPGANITKTVQSNDATSQRSVSDPTKMQITFENDTPITLAISNIIAQSSYMDEALTLLYNQSLEPSKDPNDPDAEAKNSSRNFTWYNLSAVIDPYKFDTILNDWAYKITYVIQPYLTPSLITPYADRLPLYYGPHKRYDYWYTGKNSEVINFEQELNNAFFMTALNPETTPASKDAGISYKAGIRPNEDKTGDRNVGKETQNNLITSLNSPGDWAEAKITIMGDPDFLIQDSPGNVNDVYNQFYGSDGVTVSANGGQVFIEIDFKEGVDYKHKDGLLTLNQTITFWQDYTRLPSSIRDKIKGISYQVLEVTSDFSKGRFTQILQCTINSFPQANRAQQSISQRPNQLSNTVTDTRTSRAQGQSVGGQSESPTGNTTSGDLVKDMDFDNFYYNTGEFVFDNRVNIGNVSEINQITSPVPNLPEPIIGVEASPTFAGFSNRPIIIEDNLREDQPIGINIVVADDDGTIDKFNQLIVDKASEPTTFSLQARDSIDITFNDRRLG